MEQLTGADIDTLEGRALDIEVAVRVMGTRVGSFTRRNALASLAWTFEPVPAYSTTWEGMGLVIEAMHKKGCIVTMSTYEGFTYAEFKRNWEARGSKGDTLPTAVCRAALKALSEEAPHDPA